MQRWLWHLLPATPHSRDILLAMWGPSVVSDDKWHITRHQWGGGQAEQGQADDEKVARALERWLGPEEAG